MNALTRSTAVVALGVILSPFAASSTLAQTATIYVDIVNGDPDPPNRGQNGWGANAYRFLQDALLAADDLLDEPEIEDVDIWVAAGTYRPDQSDATVQDQECTQEPCFLGDGDRDASFDLRERVAIYGGFPANAEHYHGQNQPATFEDRDWVTYETILSGDLEENDNFVDNSVVTMNCLELLSLHFGNYEENSHHVVRAGIEPVNTFVQQVDSTGILDGFIIEGGTATVGQTGEEPVPSDGAGIRIVESSPTIRNVTVRRNEAVTGAGVYIDSYSLSPRFENCVFKHNQSSGGGAGVHGDDVKGGRTVFLECTFA